MKKTKTLLALMLTLMVIVPITVFASGSYSSTYDMTGGVFSKYITPTSYVKTTITPTKGVSGQNIAVIWAKKYWYGWDGSSKSVSSTKGGSATHYSSATRKVWLRNYTGQQMTGKVTFKWD